jgi:type I restriction enzyme S subunit
MNDLPDKWLTKPLGEVCKTVKGKKPKNSGPASAERTVPYINIKAFESGQPEEFAVPGDYPTCERDDVLIVWDGARAGLIGRGVSGYIGSTLAKVYSDLADSRYLYYFLWSQYDYINSRTKGVGIPHVDPTIFNNISFPIAPIDQQKRIVAEIEKQFSRLDEAVANLKRVKANLKRYKAAVLKAAVQGRLVETKAQLTCREGRDYETGAELLQRILETRRRQWKGKGKYKEPAAPDTTDLPELPEGWVWVRAEQISDFITKGTTPAANKLMEGAGDVQFLKVYNLTFDGSLNHAYKPAYVSRETHEGELARSKVVVGDVLINIVGPPLGQVSVVPPVLLEANINQAIARFRPVTPLGSKYLVYALMAEPIVGWAIRRAKTTAGQSNLTLELCRELPIPLPPLAEQHRIVVEVDRRFSLVREVEIQVETNLKRAERLQQAILREAFSGRLLKDDTLHMVEAWPILSLAAEEQSKYTNEVS